MADEEFPQEDELESRQAAALYPVGRVLRQTWDADNHDSLGTDLTSLMLQLARVDPDAAPLPRGALPVAADPLPVEPPPIEAPAPTEPVPWWRAAVDRIRGARFTGSR